MKKEFIRCIVFLVLTGGLFYKCYHVLGYYDNVHSAAVFNQFYDLDRNIVDVIWIGPSAVQEFVIPTEMYDETGISLYPLSVGNEPFSAAKNLIKECEKRQNPDIYMVDIRYLAYTVWDDTCIRRITDNMKCSGNRVETIHYMLDNLKKYHGGEYDNMFDYVFSFTKYHTRWNELKEADFSEDDDCFFGYFIKNQASPFDFGNIKERFNAEEIAISEENQQYLDDLMDYCDSLGKKVIFTCTPNCLEPEYFSKYNYAKETIKQRGYEVWDLNEYVDEIGLDYSSDFADEMHTNVYGATKVSKYVARRLSSEYNIEDHRGDKKYVAYDDMSKNFHEKLQEAELKTTTNFNRYLDRLLALDKNEYTIYIAEKDIQGWQLTSEMTDKLKRLGFDQADILLEHIYHSFIGVIANGEVICQQIGQNDEPSHYQGLINGQKVSIASMTWKGGNIASIKLGQDEYAKNTRGLNFVVVDNKDGMILDSVAFDTHAAEIPCTR